jgi:hypothetical protein
MEDSMNQLCDPDFTEAMRAVFWREAVKELDQLAESTGCSPATIARNYHLGHWLIDDLACGISLNYPVELDTLDYSDLRKATQDAVREWACNDPQTSPDGASYPARVCRMPRRAPRPGKC